MHEESSRATTTNHDNRFIIDDPKGRNEKSRSACGETLIVDLCSSGRPSRKPCCRCKHIPGSLEPAELQLPALAFAPRLRFATSTCGTAFWNSVPPEISPFSFQSSSKIRECRVTTCLSADKSSSKAPAGGGDRATSNAGASAAQGVSSAFAQTHREGGTQAV